MDEVILKKITDSLNYFDESERIKTFPKKWVYKDSEHTNARKMAEAGFIYSGNTKDPDIVQCFFCRKELEGWDEDDDPWKEHLSHNKECQFAQLQKPQENLTLEEFLELKHKFILNSIEYYYQKKIEEVSKCFDETIQAFREILQ